MPFFLYWMFLGWKDQYQKLYWEEAEEQTCLCSYFTSPVPICPVSQFLLSPCFLTSVAIHCVLSHFSYKSLFKGLLHKAQKQKSFSANSATIHKQVLERITQLKLCFRKASFQVCGWVFLLYLCAFLFTHDLSTQTRFLLDKNSEKYFLEFLRLFKVWLPSFLNTANSEKGEPKTHWRLRRSF